jgi:hypothetical protein
VLDDEELAPNKKQKEKIIKLDPFLGHQIRSGKRIRGLAKKERAAQRAHAKKNQPKGLSLKEFRKLATIKKKREQTLARLKKAQYIQHLILRSCDYLCNYLFF